MCFMINPQNKDAFCVGISIDRRPSHTIIMIVIGVLLHRTTASKMADTTERADDRNNQKYEDRPVSTAETTCIDSSDDPIYVKTERSDSVDRVITGDGNEQGFELSVTSTAGSITPDGLSSNITCADISQQSLVLMSDNKWTPPATGLLLDLYKQNENRFNSSHIKKKVLWREISEKLNREGYMFDSEKCERKFLNLKTTYRYTVDHNLQTGNQKRCAFYEQLDDIFRFQIQRDSPFSAERSNQAEMIVEETFNRRAVPVSLTAVCDLNKSQAQPVHASPSNQIAPRGASVSFTSNNNTVVVSMEDEMSHSSHLKRMPQTNTSHPVHSRNTGRVMESDYYNMPERFSQGSNVNRSQLPSPQNPIRGRHFGNNSQSSNHNRPRFTDERRPSAHEQEYYSSRYREEEEDSRELPSSSGLDRNDDSDSSRFQRGRKRKHSELDNLLATFEKYREEQRQREEQRMKCMKEWHDEEMKVMNRFLDIIQQSIQSGKNT